MNPTVSFVVWCTKSAHLPKCLDSILGQSYGDLEVLLMDDCLPDDTPVIATRYQHDKRLHYIKHQNSVGALHTYNNGIRSTRGKYIWSISENDYLRLPYALERYVSLLDRHAQIGYAFCPAVRATPQGVGELLTYSKHGNRDRVLKGSNLFRKLILANTIAASSVIVRRECYTNVSLFPLDRPYPDPWYLWCLFSLHYDVGYIAEPLICCRPGELGMSNKQMKSPFESSPSESVGMPWLMRRFAIEASHPEVEKNCLKAVASEYARTCSSRRSPASSSTVVLEEFERSLCQNTTSEAERRWIRARVFAALADSCYWQREFDTARQFYRNSLKNDPRLIHAWSKWLLLNSGRIGTRLRGGLRDICATKQRNVTS